MKKIEDAGKVATPPSVFISYVHYEDETSNREPIAELSALLRSNGVDCHIDQYDENKPPSDWLRWMDDHIQSANFVLVYCTPTYRERFEAKGDAGVGKGTAWEGAAISAEIFSAKGGAHKFIPITPGPRDLHIDAIPVHVLNTTSYDCQSDLGFSKLLRRLLGFPELEKPSLGSAPNLEKVVHIVANEATQAQKIVKELLLSPGKSILLEDYFANLVDATLNKLDTLGLEVLSAEPTIELFRSKLSAIEDAIGTIAIALSTLARYGTGDQLKHLRTSLESLVFGNESVAGRSYDIWRSVLKYPVTYCLYCAGISALQSKNWASLHVLINKAQYQDDGSRERRPIASRFNIIYLFGKQYRGWLDQPHENAKVPGSEYLFLRLMGLFSNGPMVRNFELAFDQWEYFLSQTHFDKEDDVLQGRFTYKLGRYASNAKSSKILEPLADAIAEDPEWPGFKFGFLRGDPLSSNERVELHLKSVAEMDGRLSWG